jgi:hypothetical protein
VDSPATKQVDEFSNEGSSATPEGSAGSCVYSCLLGRLDPNLPIDRVQTLEELRNESIAPQRLTATLIAGCLVLEGSPHALRDHRLLFIRREKDLTVESVWTRDDHFNPEARLDLRCKL